MLKCGISRGAVDQKMRAEGVDPSLLDTLDDEVAVMSRPSSIDLPTSAIQSKRVVQDTTRPEDFDPNLLKQKVSGRATAATEIQHNLRSLTPTAEDLASEHRAAADYRRAGNSKRETLKQVEAVRNMDGAPERKAIVAPKETHSQTHARMMAQITKIAGIRLKKGPSWKRVVIPTVVHSGEPYTASLEKCTSAQDMGHMGPHGRKTMQKASIIPQVDRSRLVGTHKEVKPIAADSVAQRKSERAVLQQEGKATPSPPVAPIMKRLMEDLRKTVKSTAPQSQAGEPEERGVVRPPPPPPRRLADESDTNKKATLYPMSAMNDMRRRERRRVRPPPPPPRRLADEPDSSKKATIQPMPAMNDVRRDESHKRTITGRSAELSATTQPPSGRTICKSERHQDHATVSEAGNVQSPALDGLDAGVVVNGRHYSAEELESSLAQLEARQSELQDLRASLLQKKKGISCKLAEVAAEFGTLRDEIRLGATTEQLREKRTYVDVLAAEVATVEADPSSEETRRVLESRVELQEDARWAKSLARVHRDNVNAAREVCESAAQAGLICADAAVAELRETWATKINAHRDATAAAKLRVSELKSRLETHTRLLDQRRAMQTKTDLILRCEEAALREARATYHQVAVAADPESVFDFLDKLRQDRLTKSRQACDLLRAAAATLSAKARAHNFERHSNTDDINLRAEMLQAPTTRSTTNHNDGSSKHRKLGRILTSAPRTKGEQHDIRSNKK